MKKYCKLVILTFLFFLIYFFIFYSDVLASNITMTEDIGSGTKYKWTQTIVYHSNYPSGTDDTVTVTYNISYLAQGYSGNLKTFNELNFSVPLGYELKSPRWNTMGNGSGTSSDNLFYFSMNNRNKTTHLYAQYKSNYNNFSLIYNANGGKDAPANQYGTSLESSYNFIISNTEPTKEGYEFLGWSTSSTASSPSYYSGGTINVSGTSTLYAVWKKEAPGGQYTIEWYDAKTEEEIKSSEQRKGIIGKIVSVTETDKIINGYIFDEDNKGNILSDTLSNSSIVLRLYFTKDGEQEPENPDKPEDPENPSDPDNKSENITNEKNPITKDNILITALALTISFISFVLLLIKKKNLY